MFSSGHVPPAPTLDRAVVDSADRRHVRVLGEKARRWRSNRDASRAAERELVELARAGMVEAEGELMEVHSDQIRGECWRLCIRQRDLDDYVQEGKMAMRYPILRFDPERDIPLWFYARPFVRRTIIYGLGGSLGLTRHQAIWYRPVWSAHDALVRDGLDPTPQAVRAAMSVPAGMPSIEAILAVGRRWLYPFDESRDSGK